MQIFISVVLYVNKKKYSLMGTTGISFPAFSMSKAVGLSLSSIFLNNSLQ